MYKQEAKFLLCEREGNPNKTIWMRMSRVVLLSLLFQGSPAPHIHPVDTPLLEIHGIGLAFLFLSPLLV